MSGLLKLTKDKVATLKQSSQQSGINNNITVILDTLMTKVKKLEDKTNHQTSEINKLHMAIKTLKRKNSHIHTQTAPGGSISNSF